MAETIGEAMGSAKKGSMVVQAGQQGLGGNGRPDTVRSPRVGCVPLRLRGTVMKAAVL